MPPLDLLFLDLSLVVAAAWLFGAAARRLGQPAVIGEIVAGVALGPSLLGHLRYGRELIPSSVLPALSTLADAGLAVFMFLMGMALDHHLVRGRLAAVGAVAAGATAIPFALGCTLALWLAPRYAVGDRLSFVLFIGVSLSATAFPVLARILTDRGMQDTRIGGLAMAAASAIDAVSYVMLAVALATASIAAGRDVSRLALVPVYLAVMLFVVRPGLRRLDGPGAAAGRPGNRTALVVLAGLFASAWLAQWLQINFVIGAFLFGAVMPRSPALATALRERFQLASDLMLPAFFVVTGLGMDLSALRPGAVAALGAILAVAFGGKLAGGYLGARAGGLAPHDSAVLAILVNTRGLTEIVILTLGLQQHVLPPDLYSLLVVMAIVTTAATGPVLNILDRTTLPGRTMPHAG